MNLHSLTGKISLVFLFTFFLVISFFVFYIDHKKDEVAEQVLAYHAKFSHYFHEKNTCSVEIEPYLENFSFEVYHYPREVLTRGKKIGEGLGYESYFFNGHYYYYVQRNRLRKLFRDLNHYERQHLDYFAFAFVLLLLMSIYFWLIRSLKPLHTLKDHINLFANGELEIDCRSFKKDEIALVSNEFHDAVKQIQLLLESRQLFLRTVMHELKTPIAKGRIVCELVEEEVQKQRLIFIFEKLNYLINDFSKIEEVISQNCVLKEQSYRVSLLVDNAIEMLLLEEDSDKIEKSIEENPRISVDFELISLVIKNLMDNAIKYSPNSKAKIYITHTKLSIISQGEALSMPIESYFRPFHNEIDKSKQGMGLGLYIVKSILDLHNMKLIYSHKDKENIFSVMY